MFLFIWNWGNFPFFLRCRNNTIYYTALMNELSNTDVTITSLKQNDCNHVWEQKVWDQQHQKLMGPKNFDSKSNQSILTATIKPSRYTKRFNELLFWAILLTLSWRRPLSYRKQSIDSLCKSMDWFLYDKGLRHERVNNPR